MRNLFETISLLAGFREANTSNLGKEDMIDLNKQEYSCFSSGILFYDPNQGIR